MGSISTNMSVVHHWMLGERERTYIQNFALPHVYRPVAIFYNTSHKRVKLLVRGILTAH